MKKQMRLWKKPSGKNASARVEATKDGVTKLFGITYRAWMIACFQEMHRISRRFGADFDMVADFLEDTHRVRLDRPVMFPGVIGGHCLIPNAELLLKSYDSTFLIKQSSFLLNHRCIRLGELLVGIGFTAVH